MPPKTKAQKAKIQNLQKGKEKIYNRNQSLLNPLQFAYSILIYGLSYKSVALCFMQNNINPFSHSTYYKYVDIVIDKIIALARECAEFWKNLMQPNTIISLDGSWDHRRNGRHCIVAANDQ